MVVFGKRGCIRAKWLYSGKVVVFGQSGCTRETAVVFEQSGCIRVKWLYSVKSWCVRAKLVVLGQGSSIRAK